jgi:hypothetical protein
MTLRIAPVALLSIVTQSTWWQAISAADAETAFGERQALCDRDKGALRGGILCNQRLPQAIRRCFVSLFWRLENDMLLHVRDH